MDFPHFVFSAERLGIHVSAIWLREVEYELRVPRLRRLIRLPCLKEIYLNPWVDYKYCVEFGERIRTTIRGKARVKKLILVFIENYGFEIFDYNVKLIAHGPIRIFNQHGKVTVD